MIKCIKREITSLKIKNGKLEIERKDKQETICDICKKPINSSGFDCSEVEFNANIGDRYPEGDFRTGYRLDICPDCFINKVKPLIEGTYNTKFTEYECRNMDNYNEVIEEPLTEDDIKEYAKVVGKDIAIKLLEAYNDNFKREDN